MRTSVAFRTLLPFTSLAFAIATAQAETSTLSVSAATRLDTLVVTGHRGNPRTEVDSLSPVDVFTEKDLAAVGAHDLAAALRVLLPSLNFPDLSLAGPTDANIPAQLRGLAPDQTLVLIDGKRRHTTAMLVDVGERVLGFGTSPVDFGAIPLAAVERVEVLRDGAAAQYGSDAIAGVINVILKKGAEQGGARLTHGTYGEGGGDTWQGSGNLGTTLGENGWLRASVNALHQNPANRAGPDIRYPNDPTYGEVTFHYGKPWTISRQAGLNAQYDLTPEMALYGFSLFNTRDVRSGRFFRSLSDYATSYPESAQVYPRGFLPAGVINSRDDSTVVGIRGQHNDLQYDISLQSGGNHFKRYGANTINHSLGLQSPTRFYVGTLSNRQNVLDANFVSHADLPMLPNLLTIAWGAQLRHDAFTLKPGEAASFHGSGAVDAQGFLPEDAGKYSRRNRAVYVDFSTDFSDRLSSSLALRQENYSDFGNNFSWKATSRYAFSELAALRGTVATGFRAPSLQQSFYSSTSVNYINVGQGPAVLFNIHTFPSNDPAAIALGAQPLQPETSRHYSLGLVLTPGNDLHATLDLYQVSIRDNILLSGNLVGEPVRNYLQSIGIDHVAGGRFFTNAIDTRTRGADLVLSKPWELDQAGTLQLTFSMNYTKTDIRHIKPNPPQLGLAGLTLPVLGREAQGRITGLTPRTKAALSLDWQKDDWTLTARLMRYGRFHYMGVTPAYDQGYATRYLLDLSARRHFGNGWSLTLGSDNVNSTHPDQNNALNSYYNIGPDPMNSPFGFSGAYYYATLDWSW